MGSHPFVLRPLHCCPSISVSGRPEDGDGIERPPSLPPCHRHCQCPFAQGGGGKKEPASASSQPQCPPLLHGKTQQVLQQQGGVQAQVSDISQEHAKSETPAGDGAGHSRVRSNTSCRPH